MSTVPHKARVAVILGALVLAVATSFATALSQPSAASAADIARPGPSSSGKPGPVRTRRPLGLLRLRRALRLPGHAVWPRVRTRQQGVAAWLNWERPRATNLLVVSSYRDGGDTARLFGIDAATRQARRRRGDRAHARRGHRDHATAGRSCRARTPATSTTCASTVLSQLRGAMNAPRTPAYLKQIGKARQVYGSAFIWPATATSLYAGRFNDREAATGCTSYKVTRQRRADATQKGAYEVPDEDPGPARHARTTSSTARRWATTSAATSTSSPAARAIIDDATAKCFRAPSMSRGHHRGRRARPTSSTSRARRQYVQKAPRNVIPGMHTAPQSANAPVDEIGDLEDAVDLLGPAQQGEAPVGRALGGHHEQAQAGGVDELQPAQVDDDRGGVAGFRVAQRLLEPRRAVEIEPPLSSMMCASPSRSLSTPRLPSLLVSPPDRPHAFGRALLVLEPRIRLGGRQRPPRNLSAVTWRRASPACAARRRFARGAARSRGPDASWRPPRTGGPPRCARASHARRRDTTGDPRVRSAAR